MTIREILKSLFTSTEVQSLAEKIYKAVLTLGASNPVIAALAANLKTELDGLRKARKNGTYNTQTELVVEADEARDLAFRAFWLYVKAAAIRQNEAISQAAQALLKHVDKFDSRLYYMGYSAQTAELNLFFAEMKKVPEHVDGCGAREWLDELEDSQDGFVDVQGGKVDEEIEKKKPPGAYPHRQGENPPAAHCPYQHAERTGDGRHRGCGSHKPKGGSDH